MWELKKEVDKTRHYHNPITGSHCSTTFAYQDKEGNSWYSFDNLFTLPFMRQFAATKISSLYQVGLSKDDLTSHCKGLKDTLKSTDTDKYEKCYALVIDFESKMEDATNAIKQIASLVCVYNVINDERVDLFDPQLQDYKMKLLEADLNAQAFFLKRQIERTETYGNHLDLFLKTASQIRSDISEATDLNGTAPIKQNGISS